LVVSDYFTKWSEAYLLKDCEASTCMSALYAGFFSRFGLPRSLHSDQGRNCESLLFAEFCKIAGITKSQTTLFHPRSDGQVERLNKTILQVLRATAYDSPSDWPSKIHTLLAAYRMTVHSVTEFTLNFLMLDREVLLPATLIAASPEVPITTSVSYVERFQNDMHDAHARVRQTIRNVAKTQKASFDKTVKGPTFSVGQQVWLYWPKPLLRQQRKKNWLNFGMALILLWS